MNLFSSKPWFSDPRVQAFLNKILFVKKTIEPSHFYLRTAFFILLVVWGLSFFDENDFEKNPYGAMDSFWHRIHLPFHEAGHLIFNWGEFMNAFGGTLMQCLVPIVIMVYFIRQKDNFSASFGLWWLGQSLLDIAPYIYDAHDQKLILLGGGTGRDMPGSHDWHYLLSAINRLDSYAQLASSTVRMGKLILCLSFIWGGIVLYRQFLILKDQRFKKPLEGEEEHSQAGFFKQNWYK